MLLERYQPEHPETPPVGSPVLLSAKSTSDMKRLSSLKGWLDVKVVQARNMSVQSDLLHPFSTMDAYAVITATTETGPVSHQTRVCSTCHTAHTLSHSH